MPQQQPSPERMNESSSPSARKKHRPSAVGSGMKRVVVIGAGFAGLSAARTILGSAGDRVEVILLEAGSDVGGRARRGKLPSGAPVEMGSTWFHGICGNPLYEIAVWEGLVRDWRGDPGLRKHSINWKVDFSRPHCPTALTGHLKEIAEEALQSYQEGAMELSGDQPAYESSVGAFLRRKFDEAVLSHNFSPEELAVFAESWLFREKQQCSFDGFFTTDDVSTIFPWEFETLDGPNMPSPGGFQAIAQSLASTLDVRFEHRVTSIEWGTGGVSITCSNGFELEADAVLVTVSIGVLQAHHRTLFQPPLPEWKQAALNAVRLGVADKIFLEWEFDPSYQPADSSATAAAAAIAATPSIPASGTGTGTGSALGTGTPLLSQGLGQGATGVNAAPPSPQNSHTSDESQLKAKADTVYQDPWNVGRRGVVEEGDVVAACAAVEVAMAVPAEGGQDASCSSGSLVSSGATFPTAAASHDAAMAVDSHQRSALSARPRRARRKEEILSHALMWPVHQPMLLGTAGMSAVPPGPGPLGPSHPHEIPPDIPGWLYGLHAVRFRPGPCFIQPSEEEQFREHQRLGLTSGQEPPAPGPVNPSAVMWITGAAALEMERLSCDEVAKGIVKMFELFPSVPLPAGVKGPPRVVRTQWGTDENFLGSYSYLRSNVEDGEAVDMIAEPLTDKSGMPVVMFAGEATHRHFMGTVHGAYMSGFREAQRFLAAMEQQEAMLAWSTAGVGSGSQCQSSHPHISEAAGNPQSQGSELS